MKRKIYATLFYAAALMSLSCHGDLNVTQPSYILGDQMWKTSDDVGLAVNGIYTQFRLAMRRMVFNYGDLRSGLYECMVRSTNDAYVYNNIINSTIDCGTNWEPLYKTINICNQILDQIDEIPFEDETLRSEYKGHAYFMRAYCYFTIARVWGDAPIVLKGTTSKDQEDLYPVRSPADEVFERVRIDLEAAEANMPVSTEHLRKASPGAIRMLKAEYYLWMARCRGGGTDALTTADGILDDLLDDPHYELLDDFAAIFGVANETNRELIFTMNMARNEYTDNYTQYFFPLGSNMTDQSLINNPVLVSTVQYKFTLEDSYKEFLRSRPEDKRVDLSFGEYVYDASTTYVWPMKFQGEWVYGVRYHSSDVILYRLAEVYLMKAEIAAALGQSESAVSWLNRLCKRAYGVEEYYPDTLAGTQLDNAIIEEYLREFVMECKSWWTYMRFGVVFERVPSLVGREGETNICLWPVYYTCITTNPNITQTPGYN